MLILGIETSCDETSVALVRDGVTIVAEATASSQDLHVRTQGIVPEVAARAQVEYIIPLLDEVLSLGLEGNRPTVISQLDGVAVTYGPGLIGSLLVGVETAKTLAWVWQKPLYKVNHLVAHFYASFLQKEPAASGPGGFPSLSLVVSGGHTDLVLFSGHGRYRWLGGTRDDAAGEAFDKAARLLGLGYPGGPEISKEAEKFSGTTALEPLPRPLINSPDYDFSFSGLKSALFRLVGKEDTRFSESPELVSQLAHNFQSAVVDCLVAKTEKALREFRPKSLVAGGGVAANTLLREKLGNIAVKNSAQFIVPPVRLCTDNAAMIASAAYFDPEEADVLSLHPDPSLHFK